MNIAIIKGRLTADPEVKTVKTANGEKKVARYTLAVDRYGKDAGADFIPCIAWEKAADFAEKWLKKGTPLAVHGSIRTGRYEDEQLHRTVYTWNVNVIAQEFAGPKPEAEKKPEPQADADGFIAVPESIDEELPFM